MTLIENPAEFIQQQETIIANFELIPRQPQNQVNKSPAHPQASGANTCGAGNKNFGCNSIADYHATCAGEFLDIFYPQCTSEAISCLVRAAFCNIISIYIYTSLSLSLFRATASKLLVYRRRLGAASEREKQTTIVIMTTAKNSRHNNLLATAWRFA